MKIKRIKKVETSEVKVPENTNEVIETNEVNMAKEKPKKIKLKKANIFIICNIIVILGLCGFYGYRLVHYYKLEHPKTVANKKFAEILTTDANLVYDGDGLYKTDDNEYLFRGIEVNNYVAYSGRLWRIVKVNKDNSIKLVTADNETILVWGLDNEYNKSYVASWLKDIFFPTLNQPDKYLVEDTYCIDKIEEDITICKDKQKSKYGLLSYNEYSNAGLVDSYLNIKKYFWTINGNTKDDTWFVTNSGKMSNVSHSITDRSAYGVRPTITLNKNIELTGGTGTLDDPYTFENKAGQTIAGKLVGEYVNYSGMTWRIISKNDTGVKVALEGFIKGEKEDYTTYFSKSRNKYHKDNTNIGYYLNNDFYKTLENSEYVVLGKWGIGQYNDYVDYDYTNVTYQEVDAYVGLLNIGDPFIDSYSNYSLITGKSSVMGTVLSPTSDGTLVAENITANLKVRPALYLKGDLSVKTGDGSKSKPYEIG